MLLNIRKRVILQSRDGKSLLPNRFVMASGNLLLGYGRNSIGDITLYRSGGMQRARARNRNPHNPRSASQAVQRMILATAAKMASAYEPIVNHSWEGKEVGATSVQYFRKLAMATLRAAALSSIKPAAGQSSTPVADFMLKGAPSIGIVEGLKISEGRLPVIGPLNLPDDTLLLTIEETLGTITDQASYEEDLAKIGLEPGDQLTIVWQSINLDTPVAAFGSEHDFSEYVRYCRVTFKTEPTITESTSLVDNGYWNPVFVESIEGNWPTLSDEEKALEFNIGTVGGYVPQAATLIRSKRVEGGKVYYSSAEMVCSAQNQDDNDANDTYQSYMNSAETEVIGEQLYLKNAVAAPFTAGE